MEFLKIVRRRSFVSEVVYTALNIGLALAVVLVIKATGSPWPAIGLVFLSKWRVLAVRPRYWFANVQANLVDLIVSISLVVFLYATFLSSSSTYQKLFILIVLTSLYVGWLLFLKPRSKRSYVVTQAGVALFGGVAALFTLSYDWPVFVVVLLMWLIGYSTARHVLASYDETHISFLSLLWGFVMAEFGWLVYHWTVSYGFPRVALVILCIGFVLYKSYDSYYHHQKVRGNDILLPVVFALSIILVLPPVLNLIAPGNNFTIGL